MALFLFVSLQNDDIIARFDISGGELQNRVDFSVPGGPAAMTLNPPKTRLFVGTRNSNELICMRLGEDAGLTVASKASLPSDSCFVGMDHGGRYIFTAYYGAGQIAVHRWDENSDAMTEIQRITTEPNAHSVWSDFDDHYVFAPHTGPNKIYLYEFDAHSGTLSARNPPWHRPSEYLEPRHLCFHPFVNCIYSVNEGSSTVSVYDYDRDIGVLKARQTISTLPKTSVGMNGYSTAEIRITPNGNFLYASNRGHDSIACYTVDAAGSLTFTACVPAPAKPRAFMVSADGSFLYAAGQDSGELAAYKIDQDSGCLTELSRFFVGNNPMWILEVSV